MILLHKCSSPVGGIWSLQAGNDACGAIYESSAFVKGITDRILRGTWCLP